MERALLVALSPSEEETLRKIAHGMAHARGLRDCDVERLKRLALVEQRRLGLCLSSLGQQRLGQAPGATSGPIRPVAR